MPIQQQQQQTSNKNLQITTTCLISFSWENFAKFLFFRTLIFSFARSQVKQKVK